MQYIQPSPVGLTLIHERYAIQDQLGRGGFSAVYLVKDRYSVDEQADGLVEEIDGKLFALKELIEQDKQARERFTFEGEVLKRLEHPALPRIHALFAGDTQNRAYILMDYVAGPNLEVLRQQQPDKRFPLSQVLTIMAPIIEAVTYLHSQQPPILHRDIKPANIIVPEMDGKAVLVDFGIAKEFEADATTTAIRHCSPGYGAPEQYSIGTDIYGLGATLYALLTGTIPVDSLQRATQLASKGTDPLLPVHELAPSLPRNVASAIHRALSIGSDQRFSTVEEFWQAIQTNATSTGMLPPTNGHEQKHLHASQLASGHHYPRKRGILLSLVLALLILLGSGVGLAFSFGSQHRNPAPHRAITSAATRTNQAPMSVVLYPPLAANYAGTIDDLFISSKTSMVLSNIQGHAGSIAGSFIGLGLSGPFKGTLNPSGHLQFQVSLYQGNSTLVFEGTIKLGGDIAGSYKVLNQNGQFTGESGVWSVAPN